MAIDLSPFRRGSNTVTKLRKFDELKAALVRRAEDVCRHLYPNGREEGPEWCVGSVNGEPGKSFRINLEKGVFCEFNGGHQSGDLIDLWVLCRGVEPIAAYDEAAQWLGWDNTGKPKTTTLAQPWAPTATAAQLEAKEQVELEVSDIARRPHIAKPKPALAWGAPPRRIEVVPPAPVDKDSELRDIAQQSPADRPHNGEDEHDPDWWRKVPATIHKYVNADGSNWGAWPRWDNPDPTHPETKRIRPWDYKRDDEKWPEGARPLYNLFNLTQSKGAVILVEGEKCAEALRALGYTSTTCAGGSSAVSKTDWSPLRGRDVIRWPDNDAAGAKWLDDTRVAMEAAGVKSIRDVPVPPGKPPKWDCADAAADEARELVAGAGAPVKTSPLIASRAFSLKPLSVIPKRRFVYGHIYQRGKITITAGIGGSGKSALHVVEALCIATGRDLLETKQPIERCKVWLIVLEDDEDELQRRIGAATAHFNIDRSEIDEWIRITVAEEVPLFKIATSDRNGTQVSLESVSAVKADIAANDIGWWSIDPYVYAHDTNENDNSAQSLVMNALADIARATNSACALVHHAKKPNAADRDGPSAGDIRGASALVNSARHGRIVNTMSASEAAKMDIGEDERFFYFRASSVKANYSPPGSRSGNWYKLNSVRLPNGEGEDDGDGVGVVTRWMPPDPFKVMGVTLDILMAAQAEFGRAYKAGTPYRSSPKGEPWAGEVIANLLGLEPKDPNDKRKITTILETWMRSGALMEDRWSDGHQKRPIVRPGSQA